VIAFLEENSKIGGDRRRKVQFLQRRKVRDLDPDLRLVAVTLVCICGRGLPTHQIRWKSEKLFVDVRTDGRQFQSTRSSVGNDLVILILQQNRLRWYGHVL